MQLCVDKILLFNIQVFSIIQIKKITGNSTSKFFFQNLASFITACNRRLMHTRRNIILTMYMVSVCKIFAGSPIPTKVLNRE